MAHIPPHTFIGCAVINTISSISQNMAVINIERCKNWYGEQKYCEPHVKDVHPVSDGQRSGWSGHPGRPSDESPSWEAYSLGVASMTSRSPLCSYHKFTCFDTRKSSFLHLMLNDNLQHKMCTKNKRCDLMISPDH